MYYFMTCMYIMYKCSQNCCIVKNGKMWSYKIITVARASDKRGIEDNPEIIFLISQQKHIL